MGTEGPTLLLLLLPLTVGQLASFDQLQQAYQGQFSSNQEREDRSLLNTYPFNHVANQDSQHHGHATRHHQAAKPQHHQAALQHHQAVTSQHHQAVTPQHHRAVAPQHYQAVTPQHHQAVTPQHHQAVISQHHQGVTPQHHQATAQHHQAIAPRHRQAIAPQHHPVVTPQDHQAFPSKHHQAVAPRHQQTAVHVSTPHQATPQYSNYQAQGPPQGFQILPSPINRLNLQSLAAGFGLFSRFGSRSRSHSQSGVSVPGAAYSVAPAPAIPVYHEPPPRPALHSAPQFANFAPAPSACPLITGLPISQCRGAVNSCWSVGVSDVDCPHHYLCCFDGCANTCQGAVRAVVLEALPLPARVNLHRVRQPAQGRHSAGQSFEAVAAAGKRCIDKIEQVEEIEYDEVEECLHSYDTQCHTSYITEYDTQQEEECTDNYKKSCDITYSPQAENITTQICSRPLVKDCNLHGAEVCRTDYISECWTRNLPHLVEDDVPQCATVYDDKCTQTQSGYVTEEECKKWPREVCTIDRQVREKYNPVTKCEKVPQQLCGPSGCGFVPGPEVCYHKVKTVVTDIPEEVCDLQPRRTCEHVTKLVPKLTPTEECVDVPKEVCHKSKANPRTVIKLVTKKWCYTPSLESGLA